LVYYAWKTAKDWQKVQFVISRVFVPKLLTALKADNLIQKLQVIYRLMYLTNKRRQKLSLKISYIQKYK